jgi:glycosidase
MPQLPPSPTIYEINCWPWLDELGRRAGRTLTLADVPAAAWDAIAAWGVDAVWLMGVWERSPAGVAIARGSADVMAECRRALPDLRDEDLVGSPYCVRRYAVDPRLGGPAGLAAAREELRRRGVGLILDFVPNHVAPDHAWAAEHPSYCIQGDAADLERAPDEFIRIGYSVLARGRDPYFAPWTDVVQLNAFEPGMRAAAIAALQAIAAQCDGVRCDMAMLLMSDIFAQTWGERAGEPPPQEFWVEVIGAVRAAHPDFVWIAEAYWDREWALQQLGFDFCYDKRLYDRLLHDGPAEVDGHLHADLGYQQRLLRFIENHDEPRAASVFGPARHRAAAVVAATQTGARLFHEGQFEGRRVRPPVQLGRRPDEQPDQELQAFYGRLLAALQLPPLRDGAWRRCDLAGWADNRSAVNLVAWAWTAPASWAVVVVNLSDAPAQSLVQLGWEGLAGRAWTLVDALSDASFERDGDQLAADGLYVDLPAWGAHLLVSR